MNMLDAALGYSADGWHVFPVAPDKTPRVGKGGYHNATLDTEVITNHWSEFPDDNIALALRPSGLIAVDVDPRNGGHITFDLCERLFGALPRDVHAISGASGQHIIMQDIVTRRPRGKLDYLGHGKGVDVKCNGYVLVAPSVNSAGNPYTWASRDLVLGLAPCIPERWVEVLYHPLTTGADAPDDGLGLDEWSTSTDGPLTLTDAAALTQSLKQLGSRKGGNSTTFKAIRRIFHDYGLSIEDGWEYLTEWNDNCGAPHALHELERKVSNAASVEADEQYGRRGRMRKSISVESRIVRAGLQDGSDLPRPAQQPSAVETPQATVAVPSLPAPLLPPLVVHEAGSYAATLTTVVDEIAAYMGSVSDDNFAEEKPFFLPASKLFGFNEPPPQWLVEGLIVEGGIAVVATEPKSAKTWLATEIAIAVATGTPAIGKHKTKAGAVAYFYTEDLGAAISTRGKSLLKGRGLDVSAIARTFHAQPRDRAIDVTKLEDCARIVASARTCGPIKLLVLDPLRNIHTSEEDKADAMSAVFRNLRMIGTLLDCTILLVHHSAKASENTSKRRPGQRMRGSGAIHGFVDSGIYLKDLKTPNPGTFTNTVESEVKAARSAGMFELTLNIDDDPKTQSAVRATWEVGKVGETNADESKVDSWIEKALEIVDAFAINKHKGGGSKMTAPEVDKVVKGNASTKQIAREKARENGWLRQDPKHKTWHITPAGEAISKERHAKSPDAAEVVPDDDIPKGRAGAFVK